MKIVVEGSKSENPAKLARFLNAFATYYGLPVEDPIIEGKQRIIDEVRLMERGLESPIEIETRVVNPAWDWAKHLVLGDDNEPYVRGTVVPVHSVLSCLVDRMSKYQIMEKFRCLTETDIQACMSYGHDEDGYGELWQKRDRSENARYAGVGSVKSLCVEEVY